MDIRSVPVWELNGKSCKRRVRSLKTKQEGEITVKERK